MKENTAIKIIFVFILILLGIAFYANINNSFSEFADPLSGRGLGVVCDSEESCRVFCHNNRGQCESYCNANPSNELCDKLFGGIN